MLGQFNSLAALQYSLQSRASTGLRVQTAADDPVAMADTLGLAAKKTANAQWSQNITTLSDRADVIYSVLQSLQSRTSRAGEIATAGATATASPGDLNNLATEVNAMIEDAVKLGNTKDPTGGNFLFGGTASGSTPFTVTRNASGDISAVAYNGNSAVNQTEISDGLTVSVDVPGVNTGSGNARGLFTDSQTGGDFLNHLISLRDNLRAGNKTAVTADSLNLKQDENNVAYQVANNGVVQNRLTTAAAYLADHSAALDKSIANKSGADLAETLVSLNRAQNGYQAALSSSVKVMQLSILNYIQ
jgi:flagellar hook-associated protein 3 FlgL